MRFRWAIWLAALVPVCAAAALPAGAQAPGTIFRDCAACPEMVVVAAGRFTMGAAPGEEERERLTAPFAGHAAPQVELAVPSLSLGRFEVTRGEFAAFVAETGYWVAAGCFVFDRKGEFVRDETRDWRDPGFEQTDRHPVVCVGWADAAAYAAWLARKTGKPYRLPGEGEWEYAARAGTRAARPWGDDPAGACAHANVWDRAAASAGRAPMTPHRCADGFVHTAPVGSLSANAFGLHDMIGNVEEWTADCWIASLAGMPANGSARTGGNCARRVVRGGAWSNPADVVRSAVRGRSPADQRVAYRGFRVARGR